MRIKLEDPQVGKGAKGGLHQLAHAQNLTRGRIPLVSNALFLFFNYLLNGMLSWDPEIILPRYRSFEDAAQTQHVFE